MGCISEAYEENLPLPEQIMTIIPRIQSIYNCYIMLSTIFKVGYFINIAYG